MRLLARIHPVDAKYEYTVIGNASRLPRVGEPFCITINRGNKDTELDFGIIYNRHDTGDIILIQSNEGVAEVEVLADVIDDDKLPNNIVDLSVYRSVKKSLNS